MNIKIAKHSNPQFQRDNFKNLDRQWDFGFQKAKIGFKFSTDEKKAIEIRDMEKMNGQTVDLEKTNIENSEMLKRLRSQCK